MKSYNPHKDHRKRVRERFLSDGLDNFAPHNVLEFLLFYAIPQQDTNEIAHALLDKFGSLPAVFDADINELMRVDGIGENSAVLIKMIPSLARRYISDKQSYDDVYDTVSKIGKYLTTRFIGENNEVVYLLFLDSAFRRISCDRFFEGSVNSSRISSRKIIERTITLKAPMVVIAHNHPGGIAVPSTADVHTTHFITDALSLIDVRLLEHYVISDNKYTPILGGDLDSLRQTVGEDELRRFYELDSIPPAVSADIIK